MSFRYLDMEHYERIEHFRYFLSMPYPYAGSQCRIPMPA